MTRFSIRKVPVEILMNDGISYFYLGEYRTARALWQECLERCPEQVNIHNLLGIACSQGGDYRAAVRHFNTALSAKPTPEVHNNLGYALACLQRYHEAMTCFKQALAMDDYYTHASGNLNTLKRIMEGSLDKKAYRRFQLSRVAAAGETLETGAQFPKTIIKE